MGYYWSTARSDRTEMSWVNMQPANPWAPRSWRGTLLNLCLQAREEKRTLHVYNKHMRKVLTICPGFLCNLVCWWYRCGFKHI